MENYCGKTIEMSGTVASTCEVIEWIMEHDCPELDYTHFHWARTNMGIVASSEYCGYLRMMPPIEEWHEPVKGARRFYDGFNWWVAIGKKFYRMT